MMKKRNTYKYEALLFFWDCYVILLFRRNAKLLDIFSFSTSYKTEKTSSLRVDNITALPTNFFL